AVLMTGIATTMHAHADLPKDNPFASPSTLPYQLPPLDRIHDEHYVPALEFAMAEHRAQVERIAADKTAPTFDNTIVALERSGQRLQTVAGVLFNHNSSNTNPAVQKIITDFSPKLSAHTDS